MDTSSTVDRAPVLLTRTALGASVTQYYPDAGGSGQDRLGSVGLWNYVRALGWSDEAGTLTLEVSDDRTTWTTLGSALTFTADVINTFEWTTLTKRYWRWKFVNSATPQTIFKLLEDKVPDFNGLPAATSNLVTLQDAAAATDNGTVLDVLGFGTAALQVSGTFSATVTFESTVDGTNWVAILGHNAGTGSLSPLSVATAAGILTFQVAGRSQIRARVSAYTSGNVTVKGYATALDVPPHTIAVAGTVATTASNTTGNVAHGAADSGNPVKIGGTATAAAPAAVDEGDRVNASFTLTGSKRVEVTGSSVTYTTPAHTTLGVTNASQAALAANANRKYALFINNSANVIWLKIAATAVANEGVRLNAVGGSYEMTSAEGSLNTGAVNAISDVAGPSVLTVLEGV